MDALPPRLRGPSLLRGAALGFSLACATACSGSSTGADAGVGPLSFVAVTFNTGTSEGTGSDDPDAVYGPQQAEYSDLYYGDGMAHLAVLEDATAFFARVQPDVVGFQEIFYSGECPLVPEEARVGFVCESWQEGDPTVAQVALGAGYQVACHIGKTDKCAAVKRSFGTFRGCDGDLCLDGLAGGRVEGCGQGSRIGRGVIDLADGGELTLVNVHATSGLDTESSLCRVEQFKQVFEDLLDGSGEPAANGERNLILGDFNTDPGRAFGADPSADKVLEHVGLNKPFEFISDVGEYATPTYAGLFNIDHMVSDVFVGDCVVPGVTDGEAAVTDIAFFDHKPLICSVHEGE